MNCAKSLNSILLVSASLAASVLALACSTHRERVGDGGVWFVHATDPHVYLYLKKPDDANEKAIWDYQQNQDAQTFRTFLQALATLPQKDGPPAFLLITGDFGVDPCLNPKPGTPATALADAKGCLASVDEKERASRVDAFADLLSASPIPDIYFVAGNNDLPLETADDAGLGYFNQFFQDVQSKIAIKNANVRLHNLTGCYGPNAGAISNCSPDLPGTPYRMIGFPSQSFKNKDTKYASNQTLQSAQYKTFRGFFDQAVKDGKKVIIATHIPEMDDPYFLARDRYAGVKPDHSADPDKDNPRSAFSTWNVEKSLLEDWTKVLASDSLVAVLAGHLHDDHKEIYQRPYSWSTLKEHQLGYHKLFLAPPLSVKNQDGSPIQARGFSVVSLKDDHLTNRFYWFDGRTASFSPDSRPEISRLYHRSRLALIFSLSNWLWNIDRKDNDLERACILLVALLAAFLTVIAISQIPPTDNPAAKKPDDDKDKPAPDPSPFTNRFGKTILGGLGGLVFADLAKTFTGKQLADDAKCFYVVWFILFFLFLLLLWSAIRSLAEAVRSRVAVIHYPLARRPHIPRTLTRRGESERWFHLKQWVVDWFWRIVDGVTYWIMRIVNWFFSLKVPALTFFDTFINLVQGKNQTGTAFSAAVIEQQRNVVRVADTIRRKLHSLLQTKLNEIDVKENKPLAQRHVRVNISVLSADQSSVFYISRTPGSALLPFSKISVAWISVFTGKIRWYEIGYRKQNIRLFDNSDKTIPDAPKDIMLDNYYEERQDDYQAFIVIPVPQPQRAFGSNYVKGAIHISFSSTTDFRRIWNTPAVNILSAIPTPPLQPLPIIPYPQPEDMLGSWCSDDSIRTMLNDAVAVLGELLRGFNEIIYRSYIQPNQTD
jgi:hypothetical protein